MAGRQGLSAARAHARGIDRVNRSLAQSGSGSSWRAQEGRLRPGYSRSRGTRTDAYYTQHTSGYRDS